MFHLHYDTSLERLADGLAQHLLQAGADDLLVPRTVLVPQRGMEQWLVQHLAERHGIAANIEFLMPAQMVWRVLRAAHPTGVAEQSAFDRGVLRWRLLELLQNSSSESPRMSDLIDADAAQLQYFQLAGHLAELFERYQGYRVDLLDAWERGTEPESPQANLWRALVAGSEEPPRSRLLTDFLQRYADIEAGSALPGVPGQLAVFGCINISPDVLRFLGVLGRHAEVDFFLPTPCREYWADIRDRHEPAPQIVNDDSALFDLPDNPLLVALGGVGREFIAQVFGYQEVQPDTEIEPPDIEPARTTLLQRVQADVIELQQPHARGGDTVAADASLSVHVCHSPLREAQVLHDQLLAMFDERPDLEPRDVAVMVPDMATYAPVIEAVFGALPNADERFIPYTVSDRAAGAAHAIADMFLALLSLPATRLTLEQVLHVLAVPAVRRARDMEPQDLDAVREQLVAAGVRWGEDETDREAAGLSSWREFSWAFGRDRLMLGYLLGDTDGGAELVDGVAPITNVEGQPATVLARVLRLERVLHTLRQQQRAARTATQWQQLLNDVLDELIPEAEGHAEEQALEGIRRALETLASDAEWAGHQQTLDWTCIRDYLTEQLQNPPSHQRFLAGGVNVCQLVPLRSLPFRVICVLGLDTESFPRQEPVDALSYVHEELRRDRRRLGDRSIREDDRYLFLQTLMAARYRLYLSYTGINARDGTDIEPSIVLSELLDVLEQGYIADRNAVITRHPMQPFAAGAPDDRPDQPFTYRHEWQVATRKSDDQAPAPFVDEPAAAPADDVVDLAELSTFLQAPQKRFLQQIAGVMLSEPEEQVSEREPLADTALVRARRESGLFRALQDADAPDADWQYRRLKAEAQLPPLALGRDRFDATWHEIQPQAEQYRQWLDAEPEPGPLQELALPSGRRLQGRSVQAADSGRYAAWVGSGSNARRWIASWLDWLFASATGGDGGEAMAFGHSGKLLTLPRRIRVPGADAARALLDDLLALREAGLQQPLAVPPRAGWRFAALWDEQLAGNRDSSADARKKADANRAAALKEARDSWRKYESRDPWLELALRGADPLPDKDDSAQPFVDQARRLYVPIWQAMKQGDSA